MKWVVVAIVGAGCGRVAFDPQGVVPLDSAQRDGSGDATDGSIDAVPGACRTNPAYTTLPGLTNRYREGAALVSWGAARALCQADGADLWVPGSLLELGAWTGDWVGITDSFAEGIWTTVDGVPAAFLPWEPGQPDGGTQENCLRSTGALLEDRDCGDARDFVCECPAGS